MKVYVASSWRNQRQPAVVAALRAAGHEVYDFRNPAPDLLGFSWKHCEGDPPPWSAEKTREVLSHPRAEQGFNADFDAMKWADAVVMVQPCGRSAALELGWGCGAGKRTAVLMDDGQEPELMLKCADKLCASLDEVLAFLAPPAPPAPREERTCRGCEFSGWDPDGPYCTHPHVAEGMPHGVALHTRRVAERCPAPDHPHWQPRDVGRAG